MSDWRNTPIEELELSQRALNCLQYGSEIRTAGQLAATSDAELLRIGNLGRKTLRELREVLAERPLPNAEAQLEDWLSRNRKLLDWVVEHEALVALLMHGKARANLQINLSGTHAGTGEEIVIPVVWQTPDRP